jgi:tetratricopeptide (TPR) repeat protein
VLALLPLARELDARAGDLVLERYVRRVAQADFSHRAPLAREYAALARNNFRKEPSRASRLLEALRASGEEDLLLGTLVNLHPTGAQLELFEERAAAGEDPWFHLLAAQERAKAEREEGRWRQAERTLLEALGRCPARGLEYRCISIERDLSGLYLQLHELEAARRHAEDGLRQARDSGEWFLEGELLWQRAQVARFVNDAPLARALYEELREREGDDANMVRRVHQHLADIEWHELWVDAARREIDAALATGRPLSLSGAYSLSDISRLKDSPEDEAHLTLALESIAPGLRPGERVLATHVLGRFFIERDSARGQALLWRAVEEAEAPGLQEVPPARRARAYSFTSLLMDAGRQGDFEAVLRLLERERGQELPRQCLLVASVDSERTLLLVRDASGALVGRYEDTRREPLPMRLEGLVPEALVEPLRGCPKVQVLARPPLHGRAGLLPPELAWSYLTRTAPLRAPRTGPKVHLVVSEVDLPPGSSLPRLNPWTPSFGPEEKPVLLTGTRATPSTVLDAMRDATEIDLVTHGIINDRSNASYLLLASGPEGSELGVPLVRKDSLRGAPFVVLAACHAAHTSYALHEPLSLPAAFIEAGARGVLAATERIPDQEAEAFFNAIRERMRAGADPAHALRDERMKWLREGRSAEGLDSILLFE